MRARDLAAPSPTVTPDDQAPDDQAPDAARLLAEHRLPGVTTGPHLPRRLLGAS
ncbi:hypothetical protein [Kitasatospora phosalacinea]|nr:hypothetical protein [Kitasatospora phosalacinea]